MTAALKKNVRAAMYFDRIGGALNPILSSPDEWMKSFEIEPPICGSPTINPKIRIFKSGNALIGNTIQI